MDFDLSEDQEALREGARDLLEGLASPAQVRVVVEDGGGVDAGLWSAMVAQGWPAVMRAESAGGLGMGAVEVAVLLEEIGRAAAPAPFASTVLAVEALDRGGASDLADRVLAESDAGPPLGCVAWSGDLAAVRAEERSGSWTLHGRPDPAPYAPSAAVAVVTATTDGGPALFALDLDAAGRPAREPAMDRTRELGWLHLQGAPAVRLGGAESVERLVDLGVVFACAEMLGGANRVLELAVEYAKDRVQFGRPVGSFQAVKHRCADMLVDVEGMRSSTYWAAWCLGAGDREASIAASTAKVWSVDASKRVMASSLQVHGGIGFTWEHDLHLFMKRAQVDQLTFGDASFHRDRLARLLRSRVEAGEGVL